MKHIYTSIILFFFFQLSFGQIGFEDNYITNFNNSTYNPVGTVKHFVDFDGDGDLDVLLSFFNRVLSWHENIDGYGNYSQQNILLDLPGTGNIVFEVFDFDYDGDEDVVLKYENVMYWYEHIDGQNELNEGVVILDDIQLGAYKFEDMDGDNDKDIVFNSTTGNTKLLMWSENDGLNNFGPQQTIDSATGFGGFKFYVDDIDDDGDMDILGAKEDFVWYENTDGNGDFSNEHIIQANVSANFSVVYNRGFVIADYDDDGDKDIITNEYQNYMKIYENINDISFGSALLLSEFHNTYGFAVMDIDLDGDQDILNGSSNGFYWSENNNNTFLNSQSLFVDNGGHYIEKLIDIDLDGDLDILVKNYSDVLFKINSNGTFEETLPVFMQLSRPKEVKAADLDGDLDLDIVATDLYGNIFWYSNIDEMGYFSVQRYIHDNSEYSDDQRKKISIGDLDGDNDNDIISVSKYDGRISWHENLDGQGDFSNEQIINSSLTDQVHSLDLKDVDNDGDNDIVVGTHYGIYWLKNADGLAGSWEINQIGANVGSVSEIELNDLDNDNDNDVVCFDGNAIVWFENVGGLGSYGNMMPISSNTTYFPKGVFKIFDMNGDGYKDIIVSSRDNNNISFFEHIDGNGAFEDAVIVVNDANGVSSIDIADVDNDGDLDILAALADFDIVVWYENLDGQAEAFGDFNVITDLQDNTSSFVDYSGYIVAVDVNQDNNIDVISATQMYHNLVWSKNLSLTNRISGFVNFTFDLNGVGCDFSNSIPVNNVLISTSNGVESKATFSLNNGHYQLYPAQDGNYETQILTSLPLYFESNPESETTEFIGQGNTNEVDFCIEPVGVVNDLEISLYPLSEVRPGYDVSYQIVYKNVGTTIVNNGFITLDYDNTKINFQSSSESVFAQTSNSLAFQYLDLQPFEIRTIELNFSMNNIPSVMLGDILFFETEITPFTQDETIYNNSFNLQQTVIGSYDPNDISVLEGEQILLEDADKYLHYIIRFQNTGTASAININVENALDDKLDWTTMQLESLSHAGRVEIRDGNMAKFIFNNIHLPDSTNDEPNSHGYIAYKIKPKSDVEVGDIFYNTADIFFDFNPAIVTNTVSTEIVNALSVNEFEVKGFSIYPNPVNNTLTIEGKSALESIAVYDVNGRELNAIDIENNQLQYLLDVSELSQGIYFIEVQSDNFKSSKKFIKE
ncbi:T9SS type A sorting domain-containing protein [Ichthyenterobacterium magnum]|uniref:Putative secreted protein (Por secretion system target) n=1 Tax=Ichthyenterobacterium magnum TaxID=1230530 RepID=A0A420DLN7_9FLAO|nr:T9SS type A sorting domain-containing protein [Ichthyenterobacterium magnum]RKE95153.1 putative secreted protein (Por secretion system target) [Ichthyenterobacterium magnum]